MKMSQTRAAAMSDFDYTIILAERMIILTVYLKAFGCVRVSCPSKAKEKTNLQTFPIYQLI